MHFVSCTNDLREYLDLATAKNINFSNISTDTRSISKDALFIAIKGPNFDGNKFIDQAFDNGAVAVLTSDTQYKNNTNPACIYVPSVKEALIQIATRICDEFKGKKILITGSNGKTTCTFLLSNSLPNCSSTIGNFNNEIGLPLSVMQADRDSEYLVLEAGAGKPGDIAILSEIVKPHLGLITSISESHTEFLGNLEGVFNEKTSMLKFIQNEGILVMNCHDQMDFESKEFFFDEVHELFFKQCPRYVDYGCIGPHMLFPNEDSYKNEIGRESDNDAVFKSRHSMMGYLNFSSDLSMMEFSYSYDENEINNLIPKQYNLFVQKGYFRWSEKENDFIELSEKELYDLIPNKYKVFPNNSSEQKQEVFSSLLVGYHNMTNIILVARCLRHLAFYENKIEDSSHADLDRYVAKLKSFLLSDQVKSFNRSQHTKWLNGSHLINDSYNANPASLKAAIGILSHASPKKYKRRILLLGDMLELNNPVESHRDISHFILDNFFSQIPEIEKKLWPPTGVDDFHLYEFGTYNLSFGDDRRDTNKKIRKAYEENPDLLNSYTYGRINKKNPPDVLITVGDLAGEIVNGIKESIKDLYNSHYGKPIQEILPNIECYSFCSDKEEDKIKTFLNDFIQKDDIVLLKGSRGMQMERFI